jgi:hypothetical protein
LLAGCAASRRLFTLAHGAPRLLRPRPSSASRGWGPSVSAHRRVPDTPPRLRTLETPWPPEAWPRAPAERIEYPPPGTQLLTTHRRSTGSVRPPEPVRGEGGVVVRSAPRATGAMAPERAGPERASRGGVSLAWLRTNSEGPRRGTSLLGRTRRRVGGLGSRPSPSDRSEPAGQGKPPRSGKRETGRVPGEQNRPSRSGDRANHPWHRQKRASRSERRNTTAHPLGKTKPLRSDQKNANSRPAGQKKTTQ